MADCGVTPCTSIWVNVKYTLSSENKILKGDLGGMTRSNNILDSLLGLDAVRIQVQFNPPP